MVERFKKSGKERLVILMISDFDPDGDMIATSFARSIRDDFHVEPIAVRVAVTPDQVEELNLPGRAKRVMKAKKKSSHYKRFVEQHGHDMVFEVEALGETELQQILRAAIDEVLDAESFNVELEHEDEDRSFLDKTRLAVHESLKGVEGISLNGEESDDE